MLKARLSPQASRLWRGVAGVAGRALSLGTVGLGACARALVVAPHPDDEAAIAGTLIAHVRRGDAVCVVIVSDGRASRQLGLSADAMAELRRAEAERARAVMGPSRWEWLGLPDLRFGEDEAVERIGEIVRSFSPEIIYAPSRVDGHPDHVRCARAVARVLEDAPAVRVRAMQVQIPLTPVLVNCAIDVSEYEGEARAALEAYGSQRESWARIVRSKYYAAALYGARAWVDEYWEMSAREYRMIHSSEEVGDEYLGLRHHAFLDPLAYLRGLSARRKLKSSLARS